MTAERIVEHTPIIWLQNFLKIGSGTLHGKMLLVPSITWIIENKVRRCFFTIISPADSFPNSFPSLRAKPNLYLIWHGLKWASIWIFSIILNTGKIRYQQHFTVKWNWSYYFKSKFDYFYVLYIKYSWPFGLQIVNKHTLNMHTDYINGQSW